MWLHFIHFYKESKDYPIAVVSSENWLTGKDPDAGEDWRQEEGWDGWMASLTQWTESEQAPGVGEGQGAWSAAVHGVVKSRTQLSNWTELNWN